MSKLEPKFNKNDRVEFVLRDSASQSGYSHHVAYVKRATVKRRFLRRGVVVYDLCEAVKNERMLWHSIPETDIIGIVEWKRDKREKTVKNQLDQHE